MLFFCSKIIIKKHLFLKNLEIILFKYFRLSLMPSFNNLINVKTHFRIIRHKFLKYIQGHKNEIYDYLNLLCVIVYEFF